MKYEVQKNYKKTIGGYMTLEASFIIPITIMIFVLVIVFQFYLYNQCVVEQDCYIAALRGSQIKDATDGAVREYTYKQADKLLDNQLYEYCKNIKVTVNMQKITVSAKSKINLDYGKILLYNEKELTTDKKSEAYRTNPVFIIRRNL